MLAAQYDFSTRKLELVDVPTPTPGAGEVRIRVKAAGVCLSDIHIIDGTLMSDVHDKKVILGHEVAGVIDQIGPNVTGLQVGQRVLLFAGEVKDGKVLTRGVDYDGGWAEYAIATAHTVVPIPDDLPFDQACFVPDAVSTPWAAITSTAQVKPGDGVGVWGIGGLGVHAIQLLHMIGAAPIIAIDPLASVKDRALQAGADYFCSPAEAQSVIQENTNAQGVRIAFDFAGVTPVRAQALACLGKQGKLVLVGLSGKPIVIEDSTSFAFYEKQILGHYGSQQEHVEQLVKFIRYGRLDLHRSVSGVFPLDQVAVAVKNLAQKIDNPIRLVLEP